MAVKVAITVSAASAVSSFPRPREARPPRSTTFRCGRCRRTSCRPTIWAYLLKVRLTQGRFDAAPSAPRSRPPTNPRLRYSDRQWQGDPGGQRQDSGGTSLGQAGVQIVIESTGLFTEAARTIRSLRTAMIVAGREEVIISGPGRRTRTSRWSWGVNWREYDVLPNTSIISNASCTTNCLANARYVMAKEGFGLSEAS